MHGIVKELGARKDSKLERRLDEKAYAKENVAEEGPDEDPGLLEAHEAFLRRYLIRDMCGEMILLHTALVGEKWLG